MIAKTKPGSLLLGLSIIMITTVYGDIRCLYIFDGGLLKKIICVSLVSFAFAPHYSIFRPGRHYLGHDHQHHNPLQSNRGIFMSSVTYLSEF